MRAPRGQINRRGFTAGGLAAMLPLAALPGVALLLPALRRPPSDGRDSYSDYHSTLVGGLTPEFVRWMGRKWHCAAGSSWHPGMDHSVRLTETKARFELRDSQNDRARLDPPTKRRSELHFAKKPRLPNDVPLWGAMSFIHHGWADPSGMARLIGGVHGQIHMGSSLGGSPALAFRRHGNGRFRVTTRGEQSPEGVVRHEGPLSFDQVHDLVYRLILSPTNGSLAVWLDSRKIVDVQGASIGSRYAECYWNIGCYYGGGISCPVIAEYANMVYPGPASLIERTSAMPAWPKS